MKKVKLMLTAITVFAIVGGALAFKTTKALDAFCVQQPQGGCALINSSQTDQQHGVRFEFTPVEDPATCDDGNITCTTPIFLTDEAAN